LLKFIWTCLILLLLATPASAVDLPLLANAEVSGTQVSLRDLLSAADAARLDQLAGPIQLFQAPEPGNKRKVSRETLARLVERQVADEQLHLSGAASVTITRAGIWIEPEEMEAVLVDYLKTAAADLPGVELSLENIYLPPRFMVPTGKIAYQVIPAQPQVVGSRRLTLITRVDGQLIANQSMRVVLKARAQVVVTTTDLKRGETLTAADLQLQQMDISDLNEPFLAVDELIGKQLKQTVRQGQALQRNQLEFPPMIKRGERVTIQASNPGLMLKASGEARQNGELGDMIRVRNIGSQREVVCRVLAAGLVSVEF
jgi:flagella basal body P-ring formation protein FlgA